MNRRNFLRLGALFVPATLVEPRRAYSFLWAPKPYVWVSVLDDRMRVHSADDLELSIGGIPIAWELEGEPPRLVGRMKGDLHLITIKGTISI